MFFWREVRALTDRLKNIEKNARLPDDQQERVKQSKGNLGLAQLKKMDMNRSPSLAPILVL
jgi:hypothetical protein